MKVRVKLLVTYRKYLPAGAQGGACDIDVPPSILVGNLLSELGVPAKESMVILVNGRDAGRDHILEDNDVVAIFPAMAGG